MIDPTILKLAHAISELVRQQASEPPAVVDTAQFVTINLASAKTGLSEKAIRQKIAKGVWLEDQQWTRGKDGRIYIDMVGYAQWFDKSGPHLVAKRVISTTSHREKPR